MKGATDMTAKPGPRAPAIAAKLEAAKGVLEAHHAEVAQTRLDAADDLPGAAKRLADLRARISTAERDVFELEKAHALAARIDRQTAVTAAKRMRAEQLSAFESHMQERDSAVAEMCGAVLKLQASYQRYSQATLKMLGVKPVGTALPTMGIGPDGRGGSAVGNLEKLIAVEAWRCAEADENGQRYAVPFAKPLSLTDTDQTHLPPALEMFREAQAAILSEVIGQVEKIDAGDLAKAIGVAA